MNNCTDDEFNQFAYQFIDLENFYRWSSHAILLGDAHQDYAHNLHFYFNPTLGKFQFIPWDTTGYDMPTFDINYNPLASRLLSNPEIAYERNKILWEYVKDDKNLNEDTAYYDQLYKKVKTAFYKDRIKHYSNLFFRNRVKEIRKQKIERYSFIKDRLENQGHILNDRVAVKIQVQNYNELRISILSDRFSGLKLRAMKLDGNYSDLSLYQDINRNEIFDTKDILISELRYDKSEIIKTDNLDIILLSEYKLDSIYQFYQPFDVGPKYYDFFLVGNQAEKITSSNLDLNIENAITQKEFKADIITINNDLFKDIDNLLNEENLSKLPFISHADENILVIGPGTYNIQQTVIIPKNYKVEIKANTTLHFSPDVSLISYSPIEAVGDSNNKIVFTALDKNQPWGVVGVIQADNNKFIHTVFEHGRQAIVNGAFFTGMLSLYHSDAEIYDSSFSNANGDDAVNIKYGKTKIKNNNFFKNNYDALDLDYSDSEVVYNNIEDNGNDGLDISGGNVLITNNTISDNSDKCISLGERSEPLIFNNIITKCNIGIAIKDGSTPVIINNVINQNQEGLSLYIKKPIYKAPKANVYNTIIWDNKEEIVIKNDAELDVKYSNIQGTWPGERNVEIAPELLYNYFLKEASQLNDLGNVSIIKELINIDLDSAPIGLIEKLWQN